MIHVTIGADVIESRGHGEDETGCAVVSAMLYALAGGLENAFTEPVWEITSGYARIEVPRTPMALGMKLMTEIGLEQVAKKRNDVKVTYECMRHGSVLL